MQGRPTKFVVALLSIGLIGALAPCTRTQDLNVARQEGHHVPCPRHSCCAPAMVVQAVMPESMMRWERPWLADSFTADLSMSSPSLQRSIQIVAEDSGFESSPPHDLF